MINSMTDSPKEKRTPYIAKTRGKNRKIVETTFRIPKGVHKRLVQISADRGASLQELFMEALDRWHPGILEDE